MRTIYCDESGFSGNRLWDDEQPYFTYAAIQIDPAAAAEYVDSIRSEFGVASLELKGSALCRRRSAHPIVERILSDHAHAASVIVFEKKYALACKMFEYLLEPALAPISTLLYEMGFHKFIANGLYLQMMSGHGSAETTFCRFQDALRNRTDGSLIALESVLGPVSSESFVDQVLTFLVCNRSKVADEVVSDVQSTTDRWMLELTTTGLHSLLAERGSDMQPMSVYCDASKPLTDQREFFSSMVGRTDSRSIRVRGKEQQLTYNLAGPVQLADSATTPGVQLADVFASASTYALKNPSSDLSLIWRAHCGEFLHGNSVVAEPDSFDFDEPLCVANCIVFHELIELSVRGANYISELPRIIADISCRLESNPEQFLVFKEAG